MQNEIFEYIRKGTNGRVVSLGKLRKAAKDALDAKAAKAAKAAKNGAAVLVRGTEQIQIPQLRKVGVIVARNDNGLIRIGWSQCNEKSGDKFDMETALNLARARMIAPTKTPIHLKSQLEAMKNRAKKYFKGCVGEWEGDITGFTLKKSRKGVSNHGRILKKADMPSRILKKADMPKTDEITDAMEKIFVYGKNLCDG